MVLRKTQHSIISSIGFFWNLSWDSESQSSLVQSVPGARISIAGMVLKCATSPLKKLEEILMSGAFWAGDTKVLVQRLTEAMSSHLGQLFPDLTV